MGNAIQEPRQFGIGEGKSWIMAIFIAIALNLLFFGLMPGLMSQVPREQKTRAITDPIRIEEIRPPEPQRQQPSLPQSKPEVQPQVRQITQTSTPDALRPDIKPLSLDLNPALPSTSVAMPAPDFKAVPLPSVEVQAAPAVAHQGPYELSEVDTPPRVLSGGKPVYPLRARRMGVEGEVTVKFVVTKEGKIHIVKILDVNPSGYGFEEATAAFLEKMLRMSIGTKDGKQVDTVVKQTFYFDPQG